MTLVWEIGVSRGRTPNGETSSGKGKTTTGNDDVRMAGEGRQNDEGNDDKER